MLAIPFSPTLFILIFILFTEYIYVYTPNRHIDIYLSLTLYITHFYIIFKNIQKLTGFVGFMGVCGEVKVEINVEGDRSKIESRNIKERARTTNRKTYSRGKVSSNQCMM